MLDNRSKASLACWNAAVFYLDRMHLPGAQENYDFWSAIVRRFGLFGPAATALGGAI